MVAECLRTDCNVLSDLKKLSVGNVHHTQQRMDLLSFSYLMQPPEQMP